MNTYRKFCPNVYVAKCEEQHERGDIIALTTKYGKENECIVHNKVGESAGFFYYSITRLDGFDSKAWAQRKADKLQESAERHQDKADMYYDRANKDSDFLKLCEPIKVGHHSEKWHRKVLREAIDNQMRWYDELKKAEGYEERAKRWAKVAEDKINLSMPESLDYYRYKLEEAIEYHQGVKSGKYPREHSYTLTYAKKAVNDLTKKVEIAKKLWG